MRILAVPSFAAVRAVVLALKIHRGLPLDEYLLEPLEDAFAFSQRQAERFRRQHLAFQIGHLPHLLVSVDDTDKLHFELHTSPPTPVAQCRNRALIARRSK